MPRKLSWDERCAEDAEGPVRLWSGAQIKLIPSGAMGAQRPLKSLVARSTRASGTIPASLNGRASGFDPEYGSSILSAGTIGM